MSSSHKEKKHKKTADSILSFLEDRSASKWEMTKALKKSYSNIHNVVNKLLALKFIQVSSTKKSVKNPKMNVEYYDLTLSGLVWTLGTPGRSFTNIDKIATYHKDKLIIFQEWDSFKKTEIKEEMIKSFKNHCIGVSRGDELSHLQRGARVLSPDLAVSSDDLGKGGEARLQKMVDNLYLGIDPYVQPKRKPDNPYVKSLQRPDNPWPNYEKIWLEVIMKNEKLRSYVTSELTEDLKIYKECVKDYEYWLKKLTVSNSKNQNS